MLRVTARLAGVGLYHSQPDGSYLIRTVAPIAYTIPMDGTIGELMKRTKISLLTQKCGGVNGRISSRCCEKPAGKSKV